MGSSARGSHRRELPQAWQENTKAEKRGIYMDRQTSAMNLGELERAAAGEEDSDLPQG